ncbi:MAG: S41 family peptidase [bacterium]|nr:S41 family peptidase [bacterium]
MNPSEETNVLPGSFTKLAKLGVALALMLAIGFAGGVTVGAAGGSRMLSNLPLLGDGLDATPDASADLADFWKAWNALNERFVQTQATSTPPSTESKIWGAIQGLAASYGDPYTVFMPPTEAKKFQDDIRGDFQGVGMEIGVKEGVLTVIAPLKGTPAERAGLRSGDKIIMIDKTSTDGMSTDVAVKLIRGEKGTTVTFMILRDGESLQIQVVRDTITVPTIETKFDESGVYIISFYSFTANSSQLFSKAMADFRKSGSTKLMIDLRSNPGGYLESAVSIAGHFLPKGAAVVTEDYKGKQENVVHRSRGIGGLPKGTKVVVLIDQGSASASEILAGALQDANVATLVGTRSFGKGSVQELVEINGGALKVTIARWLTPAGQSISDGGLSPDIEVPYTKEDREAKADPQKARGIQFLTTGK